MAKDRRESGLFRVKMETVTIRMELENVDATRALGARIARGLGVGDIVALEGDLGAGKTALARAILNALGVREAVPSPTFTLVQAYRTPKLAVFHFDLYRIRDASELEELALEEALAEGAALVEWPERALERAMLPAETTLRVKLATIDEERRCAEITGPQRWMEFLGDANRG